MKYLTFLYIGLLLGLRFSTVVCYTLLKPSTIDASFCARLFTEGRDIGCRAKHPRGIQGILVNYNDVDIFFQLQSHKEHNSFVVLMKGVNFTSDAIERLTHQFAMIMFGIIIYDDDTSWAVSYLGNFSTDVKQSSLTWKAWNHRGNGIMFESHK
jgi:hypothetical protein